MVVEVLHDVRELNVMVALGAHPGYDEAGLNHLVGITAAERATTFKHVGLLNHAWDDRRRSRRSACWSRTRSKAWLEPAGTRLCPTRSISASTRRRWNTITYRYYRPRLSPHEVVGFPGGTKSFFPHLGRMSSTATRTGWAGWRPCWARSGSRIPRCGPWFMRRAQLENTVAFGGADRLWA